MVPPRTKAPIRAAASSATPVYTSAVNAIVAWPRDAYQRYVEFLTAVCERGRWVPPPAAARWVAGAGQSITRVRAPASASGPLAGCSQRA